MADRPDVRVEFVSNPRYLCAMRDMVVQVARCLGFSELSSSQVALAVDEALANVMKHGYGKRLDGPIALSMQPLQGPGAGVGLRIVIEDEARQVEPAEIRGRDLADIRPGGLGVHIIREVMDSAVYEKRERAGMRLTLVKWNKGPAEKADCCDSKGCRT